MQNDKEMTRSVQCSVILVSQERYHYLASDGIDTQKLDFGYPNSNRYSIRNKSTESTAEIHKLYDFQNLKIPTIWYAIAIITRSRSTIILFQKGPKMTLSLTMLQKYASYIQKSSFCFIQFSKQYYIGLINSCLIPNQ